MTVRVQEAPFDLGAELDAFAAARPEAGALASFVGLVRDLNDGAAVTAMTLEHYPGMTEKMLARIEADARARWDLDDVLIVHRFGRMEPTEKIVLVAALSAHRQDAFDACRFLMDWLKTQAPFWKVEERPDGATRWVDARASDEAAAARWSDPKTAAIPGS